MYSVDKGDTQSKEGAARVAIFKDTNLHACWTLECNYHSARVVNRVGGKREQTEKFNLNAINKKLVMEDALLELTENSSEVFTVEIFESLGVGICEAFRDYFGIGLESRIFSSPYKNMKVADTTYVDFKAEFRGFAIKGGTIPI